MYTPMRSGIYLILALFIPCLGATVSYADEGEDHESEEHEHEKRPVILDVSLGYKYGRNGFIVPAPLNGGLEDGHGGWLHLSLHPGKIEWLGFSLGVDFINKDDGNWGWGLHFGTEFEAHFLPWLRGSLSPFIGYHGERRTITLSGQRLEEVESLAGFNVGLEAALAGRIAGPVWMVAKFECGLTLPGSHKYYEWECAPGGGLGMHF